MASYLYVFDRDLYEHLICEGADLLNEQTDVNGDTVWTFALGSIHFDIQDEKYRGKCFSTNRLTMTF